MNEERPGLLVAKANALLHPIGTESEFDEAVALLNTLRDAGGADEAHKLAALVDRLGHFIGHYEEAHNKWRGT